ncbi:MAG: type II toxin-antitoxin system VapC family toxin [Stellaceae bacterium]
MIVLDTNVLSELMRAQPDYGVASWAAAQPREMLCTTSINKAEILYGIRTLPAGRRRSILLELADTMFLEELHDRVLPFDATAAAEYANIVVSRRRAGRPIDAFDAQIAATAMVFGADIATRDVRGFNGCGLTVINPWTAL